MAIKKKIVCISDTHGLHRKMTNPIPDGDILIYAGDITNNGELYQVRDFNTWLGELPHADKLVIAGNHDWCFENYHKQEAKEALTNCTYLEDQEVSIDGIKFYGSPIQPWFYDWAFNRQRGSDIKRYWDAIPDDTNVLITHGPVAGILDNLMYPENEHVGCEDLKDRIANLKSLKAHICGHIHFAHGKKKVNGVTYVNAATCDEGYHPIQKPITFTIEI